MLRHSVVRGARQRRLAIAATAAVALFALTACSSGGGGASPSPTDSHFDGSGRSLTILVPAASGAQARGMSSYYSSIADQFQKETGATITWAYYASANEEVTKIQTATVSGIGADIVSYGGSFIGTLIGTGVFKPLSEKEWNELGGQKRFIPAQLKFSGKTPSEYIGVPYEAIPFAIGYNTKYFKAAGINSPPTTWTEWVEDAQKVQKANPGVSGAGFDPADSTDAWKFVYSITKQLGGDFVSADGKNVLLDSEQVRTALQFYFQQYYQFGIINKDALSWNQAQLISAFTSGQVAMHQLANYQTTLNSKGTALEGNLAFAPLPSVPYGLTSRPAGGTPAATVVSGNYFAIPAYASATRDLALEFLKLTLSDSVQEAQLGQVGWLPVTVSARDAVLKSHPETAPFIAAQADAFSTPITIAWSQIQTGLQAAVKNIAEHLATTGSWDASYFDSQVKTAQQVAQRALDDSQQ